ncbi:hypothetical protein NBEOAGPD_2648 [Methylobacterium gregans]|uniref:Uncharacterized protein n=1 Tax=Methylobacterium gregans TaxID=374424 RepID=A0AA37HPS3_9HYPH|nr:hypothetical protein NBEOAGPD_2648 [Methylobacterium gregans]
MPTASMTAHGQAVMAAEIVHHDDVAGSEFEHKHPFDEAWKASRSIGPSCTNGAASLRKRRPATKAAHFQ